MLIVGFLCYLANVALGVAARYFAVRVGGWHHALYAVVFATAIGAAIVDFHPPLLLTLAALTVFPKARPWTVGHPLLAGLGLVGYVLCWWPGTG